MSRFETPRNRHSKDHLLQKLRFPAHLNRLLGSLAWANSQQLHIPVEESLSKANT